MTALFCIASDDASWTLKLTESWGESKSDFKEEVDGFKIEEGVGQGSLSFVFIGKRASREGPGRRDGKHLLPNSLTAFPVCSLVIHACARQSCWTFSCSSLILLVFCENYKSRDLQTQPERWLQNVHSVMKILVKKTSYFFFFILRIARTLLNVWWRRVTPWQDRHWKTLPGSDVPWLLFHNRKSVLTNQAT